MKIPFGALILLLFINAASADDRKNDVQRLYQDCKATDHFRELLCMGFVSGVGAQMSLTGRLAAAERREGRLSTGASSEFVFSISICTNPSNGAKLQAFNNWAEKHPEFWGLSQTVGVMVALREAFPCD